MGRLTCRIEAQRMESTTIPIFHQNEAGRDRKRLYETIPPGGGGIFAPLSLRIE